MNNLNSIQDKFQCADIFSCNQDNFTIKCKVCGEEIKNDFQKFLLHFQDNHADIAKAVRDDKHFGIDDDGMDCDLKYVDIIRTNTKIAQVFCKQSGTILITCVICRAVMKSFEDVRQHFKDHFWPEIHTDAVSATKIVKKEQSLTTAQQIEIDDKPKDTSKTKQIYTSNICGKNSSSAIRLKYHKTTHKREKLLALQMKKLARPNKTRKGKSTNNVSSIQNVGFASAEQDTFICTICEKSFLNEVELEFHNELHVINNIRSLLIENNLVDPTLNNYQIAAELATSYQKYELAKTLAGPMFTAKPLKQYKKRARSFAELDCTSVETGSVSLEHSLISAELSTASQSYGPTKLIKEEPKVYVYNIIASEEAKGSYCCEICGTLYETEQLLHGHMPSHTNESVICDICDVTFENSALLECHFNLRHKFVFKYFCILCTKIFRSKESLTTHINTEHSKGSQLPQTISPSLTRNIDNEELINNHKGEMGFQKPLGKSAFANSSQIPKDEDVIIINDEELTSSNFIY